MLLSRTFRPLCNRRPEHFLFVWPRTLATEASPSPAEAEPLTRRKRASKPQISVSVILNRSPIITRTPTTFERAYYAYQARIRRALSNPFPYDFYFGEGSLLRTRFSIEERAREKVAFGPRFKKLTEEEKEQIKADKIADAQLSEQEGKPEALASRTHAADLNNDTKSLDRQMQRNLYLLLLCRENDKEVWRFPQGNLEKGELLHQAAQRDLYTEVGQHMDSWLVSRNPIGVYKPPQASSENLPEQITFFFKAHIMAGQARLNSKSIKDFAWLTKEEIENYVDRHYWEGVRNILSDF